MRSRRVLVTGAAGFVGRYAMAALQSEPWADTALLGIGRPTNSLPTQAAFRAIDLADSVVLRECIAEFAPTHILHLAAQASVKQGGHAIAETWQANVGGLLNLAQAVMAEAPEATFVFVSSSEVYGRAFLSGKSLDETALPDPTSHYGRSKWIGEQILQDILGGGHLIVLRPFNHTGPGQDERFVAPSFAGQIARIEYGLARPRLSVGDLSSRREFLDVRDVVRAYVGVIDASERIAGGTVFNIASGEPRTIEDMLTSLKQRAEAPFEVEVDPDRLRPSEIPIAAGCSDKLHAVTGWRPDIAWSKTLDDLMSDARERARNLKNKKFSQQDAF
ncbi:NAD-dependent epimerase/dehydratase family protein [Methylobacterium sp. Gmos1]